MLGYNYIKGKRELHFTIEIIDEETKTVYRFNACTNEEYETCNLWTTKDCKEFIKTQRGATIQTIYKATFKK